MVLWSYQKMLGICPAGEFPQGIGKRKMDYSAVKMETICSTSA